MIIRLRKSCNLSRAGSKFKQTIYKAINDNEKEGSLIRIDNFIFANGKEIQIRRRNKPNMDYISNIEIEAAVYLILSFNKSMRIEELTKQVSRCFGFKSTSKKTSKKIKDVLDLMIVDGKLLNINNRIEFND